MAGPDLQLKPSDEQLLEMSSLLERMRGPADGLGAYLGDGITRGMPIRARILAQCLRELHELRRKNA